jgi:hypothetical protein
MSAEPTPATQISSPFPFSDLEFSFRPIVRTLADFLDLLSMGCDKGHVFLYRFR